MLPLVYFYFYVYLIKHVKQKYCTYLSICKTINFWKLVRNTQVDYTCTTNTIIVFNLNTWVESSNKYRYVQGMCKKMVYKINYCCVDSKGNLIKFQIISEYIKWFNEIKSTSTGAIKKFNPTVKHISPRVIKAPNPTSTAHQTTKIVNWK